jgi:uncharacterized protein
MVEMTIDSIRMSMMNYQRVVILKERLDEVPETKGEPRYLPIWIGPAEADAIAVKLQNVSLARPLTHDLLQSVISSLGVSVNHIIVNELKNDTFFAKIILNVNGEDLEIDSRPSDALALAVRLKPAVPIYVDESVLESASITLDAESGKMIPPDMPTGKGSGKKGDEKDVKKTAFYDFINTLDLEDFDKHKS